MRRRAFIGFIAGSTAYAASAWAQPTTLRRIGLLSGFPENDSVGQSLIAAFRRQLGSLGWIEGRNVQIDIRWGSMDRTRLEQYGLELVRMAPDVIVAHGSRALMAVRRETNRIPILFASVSDPVASGYVESLARPGGNVTGFTVYVGTPTPKLLEALKEIAPALVRAALVITPDNLVLVRAMQSMQTVAPRLGVEAVSMLIRDPARIEPTIAAFARQQNSGLVVTTDVFMIANRQLIIAAAARNRVPAIYQDRSFVFDGGLMSYGIDRLATYREVASYVDRIFKGAKPADLPVQQPSKFEFVLNLKTAKDLGLEPTRSFLARADEVIE
jgi:putative ABC transport system substrate-binding protein